MNKVTKVTKVIVKTTAMNDFLCPTGEVIDCARPSVVTMSAFVDSLIARKQVKRLASGLPETATDVDFLKCLKASEDETLAVVAFCAELGTTVDGELLDTENTGLSKSRTSKKTRDAGDK